jgi:hypothetical protein
MKPRNSIRRRRLECAAMILPVATSSVDAVRVDARDDVGYAIVPFALATAQRYPWLKCSRPHRHAERGHLGCD